MSRDGARLYGVLTPLSLCQGGLRTLRERPVESTITVTEINRTLPDPPRRDPDVQDHFTDGLRSDLWMPHYLPHWTTPDRSAARYDTSQQGLRVRIDADQLDWRPEDRPLRVSNIQTGNYSGPVGQAAERTATVRTDLWCALPARRRSCGPRQRAGWTSR